MLPETPESAKIMLTIKDQKSYRSIECRTKESSEEMVPLRKAGSPNDRPKAVKPDGGWGWMVVLGVAVSNMTTQALVSLFGLLFIQRFSDLNIGTQGASIMMGFQTTCMNLSGLIIGPVLKKYSYRKTAAAGSILVVSGLLLTMASDSLWKLVLSYSLFTGLGLGLLSPSTFFAINSYFDKRRGRAVGLSVTGTGIGQMLLPLLVQYLLQEYGFNGTLLVLSGLSMHAFIGALLYQPIKWHMRKEEVVYVEAKSFDEVNDRATDVAGSAHEDIGESRKKKGFLHKLSGAMNMELMTSFTFVNLVVGLALVYVSNICFSMILPFFLESINFPRPRIALCMSVLSGADIVGRLLSPILTDIFKMKSKTVFFVGAVLSALARSGLVMQDTLWATFLLVSLCGIFRSALICNFNLSISEQTEPDKLPAALGLHMLFKGVAIMTFSPLIGFIRDYTKSYDICVHILSVFFLVLPFFMWLVEYLYSKRKIKKTYLSSI